MLHSARASANTRPLILIAAPLAVIPEALTKRERFFTTAANIQVPQNLLTPTLEQDATPEAKSIVSVVKTMHGELQLEKMEPLSALDGRSSSDMLNRTQDENGNIVGRFRVASWRLRYIGRAGRDDDLVTVGYPVRPPFSCANALNSD